MRRNLIPLVLALLVLVGTACSSGTPTADGSPSASPTSSGSTPTDDAAPETPKPRARAADREPTGAAAPAPPPPGRAPQHTPPAEGTYRYSQAGSTKIGAIETKPDPEGTLEIERGVVQDDGIAQRHVRRLSDRAEITSVYLFTKDEVLLTYIAQQGVECAPKPALVALKLPLEVGGKWESEGTCGDITAQVLGEVMAEETVTVDGEQVETFRVHIATEIRTDAFWQTSGAKVWISPTHRLIVKSEEASRGSFNGAPFESSLNATLLSLTPA